MSLAEPTQTCAPNEAQIVLIEDDALLSEILAKALQERFQPRSLHRFSSGLRGIAHCLDHAPNLLIVDLGLPDISGRQVIRAVQERRPGLPIVVVTGEAAPSLPAELLALGASGFIDKTSSFHEIATAVERTLAGGIFFSASVRPPPPSFRGHGVIGPSPSPSALTEREREIVRRVANGMISKEIGEVLNLSPRTVEKARADILAKLGLHDVPSLVRWSIHHGIV